MNARLRLLTVIPVVFLATRPGLSQGFELRHRAAAPLALTPTANSGVALDVDQSSDLDVLIKGGSALIANGNLGFDWSPPGDRVPTVGGIPPGFDLAADVDGDGLPDLVALRLSFSTFNTEVFVNQGLPGGFWAPRTSAGLPLSGMAVSVQLLDVDGDSFLDLLYQRFFPAQGIGLLRNLGNGTFVDVSAAQLPAIPMTAILASADVTGDSSPDLLVLGNGAPRLLQNDGAGRFTPLASGLPATPVRRAYFADADADGDMDLLIAAVAVGSPLQLWLGAGNGTFTLSPAAMPASGSGHAFADLNGDQRADLVRIAATPAGQQLEALRNLGGGQFAPGTVAPVDVAEDLGDPLLADLEADGDVDAILGGFLFFLHDGNFGFAALQRHPVSKTANDNNLVAGDVDGDDVVDLIVGEVLHRNRGDGYFTGVGPVVPAGAKPRLLADLDSDGDLDLIWVDLATQGAGVTINNSSTLTTQVVLGASLLGGRVEAVDFDGDGLLDLVSQRGIVLRNLGGLMFNTAVTLPQIDRFVAVCDLNADGLIDFVTTQTTSTTLWRNVGGFVFQPAVTPWPPLLAAAASGDFDGDGWVDIATAFRGSGSNQVFVQVWFQQPTGFIAGPSLPDGNDLPSALAAVDVNGDGALDLIGRSVWTNLGGGQFTNLGGIESSVAQFAVVDVDGDRDLDIVRGAATELPRRCNVFINRERDLDADQLPVLGNNYTITMASRPDTGIGGDLVVAALAATRIQPIAVPGLGLLHIDPQSIVLSTFGVTGVSGLLQFQFALPLTPALGGLEVYWQGAADGSNGLRLTNLLVDRLLL